MTNALVSRMEEAASTFYSECTPLRALFSGIPLIGSSLDALIGTRGQNIVNRRLKYFVDEITSQTKELEESKLDKTYLESEDFFNLFWRTFEKGVKAKDKEKVRLFVRILLRSTFGGAYRESAQEYVDLISELSMSEIRVSSAIYNIQKEISFKRENALKTPGMTVRASDLCSELTDLSEDLIDSYLKRLERTGLIRELVGSYHDYAGGAYYITEYFRKMMVYIAINDLTWCMEKS